MTKLLFYKQKKELVTGRRKKKSFAFELLVRVHYSFWGMIGRENLNVKWLLTS